MSERTRDGPIYYEADYGNGKQVMSGWGRSSDGNGGRGLNVGQKGVAGAERTELWQTSIITNTRSWGCDMVRLSFPIHAVQLNIVATHKTKF